MVREEQGPSGIATARLWGCRIPGDERKPSSKSCGRSVGKRKVLLLENARTHTSQEGHPGGRGKSELRSRTGASLDTKFFFAIPLSP